MLRNAISMRTRSIRQMGMYIPSNVSTWLKWAPVKASNTKFATLACFQNIVNRLQTKHISEVANSVNYEPCRGKRSNSSLLLTPARIG